jgi:hypothetical protein
MQDAGAFRRMFHFMRRIMLLGIGHFGVVALLSATAWVLWVHVPSGAARRVSASIAAMTDALGISARVIVGERTILQGPQRIAELAVLSQEINQTYTWQHEHLFSTKKIEFKADFTAKVGYRFNSPLEIRFDGAMDHVTMALPKAEILSIEMNGFQIVEDQNGLWNRINDMDRQQAINALKRRAYDAFIAAGVIEKADEVMRGHLAEALEEAGRNKTQIIP